MHKLALAVAAAAATITLAAAAQAAGDRGTADEATAMVKKAQAHFESVGKDQAVKDFSTPGNAWTDRDLYVFCVDQTGTNQAHGANPKLVGKNLSALKDANGKLFVAEMVEVGKAGGGWVDYTWPNPVTKKVEPKSSLVEPFGELICGVGIYK